MNQNLGNNASKGFYDFTICVPTYNRAPLLRRVLSHLSEFENTRFELIIGDNASCDDTMQVVERFKESFESLIYIRHPTDIGFARNMDSLLRRASREYIYHQR